MEQVYRSRLNVLPVDLKTDIASVIFQWGMSANHRRTQILDAFQDHHVKVTELGTGTNRLVVKYDLYALKIALDNEGIDDNRQEWVMTDRLIPYVAEAHEISGDIIRSDDDTYEITGGHLLVAAYVPALSSYGEMLQHQTDIRKILKELSKDNMLGDVGMTKKNYANYGIINNQVKINDYAYIYPASIDLFTCVKCGSPELRPNQNYTGYVCDKCKKEMTDSELRARITNEKRHEMFSKVKGLKLTKEYETFDVDPKYLHIIKPTEPNALGINNQSSEARDNSDKYCCRRW